MYNYISSRTPLQKEAALSAELLKEFMVFARTNNCYLICPMLTHEKEKIYNSAVVIDRQGNRVGEYRKTYLPDDEVSFGITPGPLQPPVFKADFGTFGIQICYDINWRQGWESLYGRKVSITNFHEEQWSIIESLSPDVRVKDILTEFELRTFEQLISDSEVANKHLRG